MTQLMERFVPVAQVSDLSVGRKVVKVEDRQIALFRIEDRFYAVDNRCPHMGYPLSMGSLRGETLTCDWHNWKFALEDGRCTFGEESVRSYTVRIEGGQLLVDLADEPVEAQMEKHLASLRRGLFRNETGRVARDAARLLSLGMRPAEVMREGALHNSEREEYGWGHALAVIADCTSLAEFYDDPSIPVVRALWSSAAPVRRYPARETPEAERADVLGEHEFRRRIDEEDVDGAEAWLRGALDGGIADSELSRWLGETAPRQIQG
jgi:nitrite reductase/ring-hydroxylating ferredoxin subunit